MSIKVYTPATGLVNAAEARIDGKGRCRARVHRGRAGLGRCANAARWAFVLADGTEIGVCLLHTNAAERSCELTVIAEES